jgi:hypothetical protein
VDREAMPTYYPGDTVRLNLEIRHRPNFRTITARLAVSPEREEGAGPFHRELTAKGQTTVETATDGSKLSAAAFEFEIGNMSPEPGAVVELLEVTGETLSGERVIFDLAEVQTPRFRYAQEPREGSPVVKHASTERV